MSYTNDWKNAKKSPEQDTMTAQFEVIPKYPKHFVVPNNSIYVIQYFIQR